jgi:hypothetical protein
MATMMDHQKLFELVGACLTAGAIAGCGSPDWTRSMNDSFASKESSSSREAEEKHRQEYMASHSRKSMRWLLSHCVDAGMSYDQVSKIMGEEGTLETHDHAFKSHGGSYFLDDEMYAWKDNEGRAVYLGFRDNRLVNFERSDFKK